MKLSKKGEYGIQALCHLAGHDAGKLVQVREIAEREAIPAKFLEGILLHLKRAGLLRSRRGSEGGYALARPAGEVMLGDVIRILDGPLAPLGSAAELKEIMESFPRQAGFYAVLLDVRNAAAGILDRTSLADVVARTQTLREQGRKS